MDTTRWKSILVPRDMYEEVKFMAKDEGRTISGQLRMIFEDHKDRKRSDAVPDGGREIHKRLVRNTCPRCQNPLEVVEKTDKLLIRKCDRCLLTIHDDVDTAEGIHNICD